MDDPESESDSLGNGTGEAGDEPPSFHLTTWRTVESGALSSDLDFGLPLDLLTSSEISSLSVAVASVSVVT